MYRFQWGEKEITLGVRGIYILACFLAGLSAGKKAKRRRFLWGFCAGALYFLIFLALSFAIRHSLKETASSLLLSLIHIWMCIRDSQVSGRNLRFSRLPFLSSLCQLLVGYEYVQGVICLLYTSRCV